MGIKLRRRRHVRPLGSPDFMRNAGCDVAVPSLHERVIGLRVESDAVDRLDQ